MSKQVEMDLSAVEALLEGTLDDLADKPSWEVFPVGVHHCLMSMELKQADLPGVDASGNKTNQKFKATAVKVTFKAIKTMDLAEVAGEEVKPLNPGDTNTIDLFFTHTSENAVKVGQGQFKEIAAVLNERFGKRSNMEVIQQTQEVEVLLASKRRTYKDKGTGEVRTNLVIEKVMLV